MAAAGRHGPRAGDTALGLPRPLGVLALASAALLLAGPASGQLVNLTELTEGPRPFIRMTCRNAQPPFSSVFQSISNTTCGGYLVDLWNQIATRTPNGFFSNFTITPMGSADAIDALSVDVGTNTSEADIALGFTSINAQRLAEFDFSIAYLEADFGVVLRPTSIAAQLSTGSGTAAFVQLVVSSLFTRSPWVIFCFCALLMLFLAVAIVVFEGRTGDPRYEGGSRIVALAHALSVSSVTILTQAPQEDIVSLVVRMLVGLLAIISFFLIIIISAVVTSSLTVTGLTQAALTIDQLSGYRIAVVAASTTVPLLQLKGIQTIEVEDFPSAARDFLAGKRPDLDGITSNTPTLRFLYNLYASTSFPAVFSTTFTQNGTRSLFALPVSELFEHRPLLNIMLEQLRADGTIRDLNARYISQPAERPPGALPDVEQSTLTAWLIATGCAYAAVLLAFGAWEWWERRQQRKLQGANGGAQDDGKGESGHRHASASVLDGGYAGHPGGAVLEFEGIAVRVPANRREAVRRIVEGIAEMSGAWVDKGSAG